MRSGQNILMKKDWDGGFSEELSNTEWSDAMPAWHKDLHCMSLSVTLIFLTIVIAAKVYIKI